MDLGAQGKVIAAGLGVTRPDSSRQRESSTEIEKNGAVSLWNAASSAHIWGLEDPTGQVVSITIAPNEEYVVSGSDKGSVTVWDSDNGIVVAKTESFEGEIRSLAVSHDSKCVAVAESASAHVLDLKTGQLLWTISLSEVATCVSISPDVSMIAVGDESGNIDIWQMGTQKHVQSLKGHEAGVTSISFNKSGDRLLSSSVDEAVRLWIPRAGVEVFSFREHTARVNGAAFGANDRWIVSGSNDGSVVVRALDPRQVSVVGARKLKE